MRSERQQRSVPCLGNRRSINALRPRFFGLCPGKAPLSLFHLGKCLEGIFDGQQRAGLLLGQCQPR